MLDNLLQSLDVVKAAIIACLAIILILLSRVSAERRKGGRSLMLFHQREGQLQTLAHRLQQIEASRDSEVLRLQQREASRTSEVLLFSEVTSVLANMQECEPSLRAAFSRMLAILSIDFGILDLGEKDRMPMCIYQGVDETLLETLEEIETRGWVLEERADELSPVSFEGYQKSRHLKVLQLAQSLLGVACKVKAARIGHFLVGFHKPHTFSEPELEGLQFCADQFAASYQMHRQLRDTQELSQLRHDYIANVSHELRTPLTTIYGYLNILKSYPTELFQEEEKQEMFGVMTDECQRLIRLINNLLLSVKVEQEDFSGNTNLTPVSLRDLIGQTCRFMERELKSKGVELEVDIPAGMAPIEGNLDLMYQVFQNLIANSIKFSSKDPRIEIVAREEGDQVTVRLSDNGVGIEPQALPRIFQKFYRAESQASKRPGLGIGLYLVQKLVQLHHGEISVASELNKGTTFNMVFPKFKAAQKQPLSQGAGVQHRTTRH